MGRTCITVRDLAEELGVDRSMLHKFIKKHGIPTFDSRSLDSRGLLSKTLTEDAAGRLRELWRAEGRDYRPRTQLNLNGERVIIDPGGPCEISDDEEESCILVQHLDGDGQTSDNLNHLGRFLRLVRESRGMTLRDVEKESGVSNAYISMLEVGHSDNPTIDVLHRLCQAYRIPMLSVLDAGGYPATIPREDDRLYSTLLAADLDPDEVERVRQFIEFIVWARDRQRPAPATA